MHAQQTLIHAHLCPSHVSPQVLGEGRSYTPSPEDVGFQLKIECSVVHAHQAYMDAGSRPITAVTSRVRPATLLPLRAMVPLPLPAGVPVSQAGRFTVLCYNLLADLYAKVCVVF